MNPRTTRAAIEAHYLPLIAQARTAAESRRDEAWLDVPALVGGLHLRALTLADFLALRAAGNAYFTALPAPADPDEARAFWAVHTGVCLWRLSLDYQPTAAARDRWLREKLAALDVAAARLDFDAYLVATFADRIRPVQTEATKDHAPAALPCSFAACWIHDFATAYGWPAETTLALPLARIFQLRQLVALEARLQAGAKPLPAGDEADTLAAAAFAEISALADPSV